MYLKTRAEHLRWSKDRAIEYANANHITDALASFLSDIGKHPETKALQTNPIFLHGYWLHLHGGLTTPTDVINWIEGFN